MITPRISQLAILAFAALCSGCGIFHKTPFSPLKPFATPPEHLAALLPVLEARSPETLTFQAKGQFTLTGDAIKGKAFADANVLHAKPDALRLRASRMPIGTVFEILQTGPVVFLKLNREGEIYFGPAKTLAEQPQIIGGVEPVEVIDALLIEENLIAAFQAAGAAKAEVEKVPYSPHGSTMRRFNDAKRRLEEYDLRAEDGLVRQLRIFPYAPSAANDAATTNTYTVTAEPQIVIEYERYGLKDGQPYPSRLTISTRSPRTQLKIRVDEAEFNPPITREAFLMEAKNYQTYPLEQFGRPKDQRRASQAPEPQVREVPGAVEAAAPVKPDGTNAKPKAK